MATSTTVRQSTDITGTNSATTVIHMLVDIVSKNGNLLLNIPVKGDGTIDDKEVAILENIAVWMDINKESIFDTRPWKQYGEGPASEVATLLIPKLRNLLMSCNLTKEK